jgi:hypothetical protein
MRDPPNVRVWLGFRGQLLLAMASQSTEFITLIYHFQRLKLNIELARSFARHLRLQI